MSKTNKIAELEALLFYSGNPLEKQKIANILNIKESDLDDLLDEYSSALEKDKSRGLSLFKDGENIQLTTSLELSFVSEKMIKEEVKEELTPATLEVLTIVAYLGPISRPDIDFIRGVNSSYTLRNLILRGLIKRKKQGSTYNYSITIDFLKHLGINKLEDLPEYDKYSNILEEYDI